MKTILKLSNHNRALGLLGLLAAVTLIGAEGQRETGAGGRVAPPRAPEARAPAARVAPPPSVDRTNHGSIRHADTNVAPRPAPPARVGVGAERGVASRDAEAEVNHDRFWGGFRFGARVGTLRVGFLRFAWNGAPYYYDDGIFYQDAPGGYQEVYAPVGATIPELPDGAMVVQGGSVPSFYAGGTFYAQAEGGYVIIAAPAGGIVPELPPGVTQVTVNGNLDYQFNGTVYQPVFVNGVTEYMVVA